MDYKLFKKEEWVRSLESLMDFYKIFAPFNEGDSHSFRLMKKGTTPDFGFQNSRLSPKFALFPQSERMFEYTHDENDAQAHILKEATKECASQAIIGIRPCDALAFQIVEVNFDNSDYSDPWWVRRFESTTLVGLGCNDPCPTCFCTSVGGGPFNEKGLDALLYDMGDQFLLSALTEKGKELVEKAPQGSRPDDSVLKQAESLAASAVKKIASRVPTDQLKEKVVIELFEAPFWENVAFPCIQCGICTYLCPTCWCFDIQDEILEKEGNRMRNWDSCMFPLFTLHGSGHNPRNTKVQRVRQRFMHKLKYYVDKYANGVACVGCGRCVQSCPANIDIRRVFEMMNDF
jgi:ferredoxin